MWRPYELIETSSGHVRGAHEGPHVCFCHQDETVGNRKSHHHVSLVDGGFPSEWDGRYWQTRTALRDDIARAVKGLGQRAPCCWVGTAASNLSHLCLLCTSMKSFFAVVQHFNASFAFIPDVINSTAQTLCYKLTGLRVSRRQRPDLSPFHDVAYCSVQQTYSLNDQQSSSFSAGPGRSRASPEPLNRLCSPELRFTRYFIR